MTAKLATIFVQYLRKQPALDLSYQIRSSSALLKVGDRESPERLHAEGETSGFHLLGGAVKSGRAQCPRFKAEKPPQGRLFALFVSRQSGQRRRRDRHLLAITHIAERSEANQHRRPGGRLRNRAASDADRVRLHGQERPIGEESDVNEHVPAWVPVMLTGPKLNERSMERSNEPLIELGNDTRAVRRRRSDETKRHSRIGEERLTDSATIAAVRSAGLVKSRSEPLTPIDNSAGRGVELAEVVKTRA